MPMAWRILWSSDSSPRPAGLARLSNAMLLVAQIVAFFLIALAIGQTVMALGFIIRLRNRPPALLADPRCPKAAVILCLRGADPSLSDCLQAIASQDYPNYEVRVVVDCHEDPAWNVAHKIAAGAPSGHFHI